jgi:hypothetical protein
MEKNKLFERLWHFMSPTAAFNVLLVIDGVREGALSIINDTKFGKREQARLSKLLRNIKVFFSIGKRGNTISVAIFKSEKKLKLYLSLENDCTMKSVLNQSYENELEQIKKLLNNSTELSGSGTFCKLYLEHDIRPLLSIEHGNENFKPKEYFAPYFKLAKEVDVCLRMEMIKRLELTNNDFE